MKQYKDFKFKDLLQEKRINTYEKLFINLGIKDYVESFQNLDAHPFHIDNVRANFNSISEINNVLKDHLINTRNEFSKIYTTTHLQSQFEMAKLIFEPKCDETIPDGIIRVLNLIHPDYQEV